MQFIVAVEFHSNGDVMCFEKCVKHTCINTYDFLEVTMLPETLKKKGSMSNIFL